MTVSRAILYRLFAGRGRPDRSLLYRGITFLLCIFALAILAYRSAPVMAGLSHVQAVYLAFGVASIIVSAVYMAMDYIQQAALYRLRVFFYLPLRKVDLRRVLWMAHVPAIVVSMAIMAPMLWHMASSTPYAFKAAAAGLSAFVVGITFHTMLRITSTIFTKGVKVMSFVLLVMMMVVIWEVLATPDTGVGGFILLAYAVAATGMSWRLFHAPLQLEIRPGVHIVHERKDINASTALFIRAVRTLRYIGANAFLLFLLAGVSCVAWYTPSVPFDAVCLLVLLLSGTLGQEARSLSPAHYPLELLWDGSVFRWLRPIWLLAVVNAVFFTDLLLAITIVWFPQGVGISYMQLAGVGVSLVGAALFAASLVVPEKDDIAAQLGSTVLYGSLAWVVLSGSGRWQGSFALAVAGSVFFFLGGAFLVEHVRWAITTRGKYAGFRFR